MVTKTNVMNCKIIKKTTPLGGVKFIAKIKTKFLFFTIWRSIHYNKYDEDVTLRDWDREYETLEGVKNAIQKYYEWKDGSYKIELIGCDGKQI